MACLSCFGVVDTVSELGRDCVLWLNSSPSLQVFETTEIASFWRPPPGRRRRIWYWKLTSYRPLKTGSHFEVWTLMCSVQTPLFNPFSALFESLCWTLLFGALWIVVNYVSMLLLFNVLYAICSGWESMVLNWFYCSWYCIIWIYDVILR